jgi:signal peptidase II
MKSRYIVFIAVFMVFFAINLFATEFLLKISEFDNMVFSLRHIENHGAAFSILQNAREFLIILACVVLTLIFQYTYKNSRSLNEIFFSGVLAAGIAGNLHERIQLGYVRDFFKLNFIDFPVFNISDIFIFVGVNALIILIMARKI